MFLAMLRRHLAVLLEAPEELTFSPKTGYRLLISKANLTHRKRHQTVPKPSPSGGSGCLVDLGDEA
jgi:hypothetical protein